LQLDWEIIKDFVQTFGWVKGVFTIFFFGAHYWVFRLYNARLKDKDDQIKKLAEENKEYRDRFTKMLDDHFKLSKAETDKLIESPQKTSPEPKALPPKRRKRE
jgi:cbb3-type cytochrome oxidase subunit 3